jgi:hypothetical protein
VSEVSPVAVRSSLRHQKQGNNLGDGGRGFSGKVFDMRMMMRYLEDSKIFEFKADESQLVAFPMTENQVEEVKASFTDTKEREIFSFLFENAKKDPGKWAEATSDRNAPGQAKI